MRSGFGADGALRRSQASGRIDCMRIALPSSGVVVEQEEDTQETSLHCRDVGEHRRASIFHKRRRQKACGAPDECKGRGIQGCKCAWRTEADGSDHWSRRSYRQGGCWCPAWRRRDGTKGYARCFRQARAGPSCFFAGQVWVLLRNCCSHSSQGDEVLARTTLGRTSPISA